MRAVFLKFSVHKKAVEVLVQFSHSVCVRLCDPMDCSTPGLPVHHQLPELAQTHVHSAGDAIQPSNHLILCHPLLFLPSIFPSIRPNLYHLERNYKRKEYNTNNN